MNKVLILAILIVATLGLPAITSAQTPSPVKVLFLGDNGPHQPRLRLGELQPVLADRGIELTYTDAVDDLNMDTLQRYDALAVYANIDSIKTEHANALLSYVQGGGGFVPLHCASFCFRNSDEVVRLIGAQFKQHGTGVFRTRIAQPGHALMEGFDGFESWDETYVHHLHNESNRTVLEYRVDENGREPWTWIRNHGDGRVFYTAWGHDHRTWTNPGFHNLIERGIRWAVKRDPADAGPFVDRSAFPVPEMTSLPTGDAPFKYTDVGAKIPNYTAGEKWGTQGEAKTLMQDPLPADESIKRMVTPVGMHPELWAAEGDLGGKPIAMTWDERGRLWVCETMDYPNELQPTGKGRDRIRICEDTDQDGVADKFTLFAEGLSIPTTLVCIRGGVIVQDGPETVYLKDIDGDDKADFRQSLITGWALGDTHGGVSNFQYGLDNWIWAMQGYNSSTPVINGQPQQTFRQGFFRFRVVADSDGETEPIRNQSSADMSEHTIRVDAIEFMRATNNNTWGLGITEDGLIFGSTANHNPSVFLSIANRYYEQVRGWSPQTLEMIADTYKFDPITDNVRQVDHHGGYTAAAGHAIYTAREYPQAWWNRTAFVCGPTGHLVGTFVLTPDGSGFKSTSPFNLAASDDEWTAPIAAEVGPDGFVWMLDWYNYIVQHNPTPRGFETGKGNAYKTELRDKRHGRVYRIVTDNAKPAQSERFLDLAKSDNPSLVRILSHPTMLWRRQAQRLLVERSATDENVIADLLALVADRQVDAIGLNAAAIHALWTLHGLDVVKREAVLPSVHDALTHPSAGVRKAAIEVLGGSIEDITVIVRAKSLDDVDPQVRLAAFLKLAESSDITNDAVAALTHTASGLVSDPWLLDAWTSSAAKHANRVLPSLLVDAGRKELPRNLVERLSVVSEHFARSRPSGQTLGSLIESTAVTNPTNTAGIWNGLSAGWPKDHAIELDAKAQSQLEKVFERLPVDQQSQLVRLSVSWGTDALQQKVAELIRSLQRQLKDESLDDSVRTSSAHQLVAMQIGDVNVVSDLLDAVTPQTSPAVAIGIVDALRDCRSDELGDALIQKAAASTPKLREAMVRVLLSRPATTTELITAVDAGRLRMSDLALDQRQALQNHPNESIRVAAKRLMSAAGGIPTADRAALLTQWMPVAKQKGDVIAGAAVFKTACANCHRYGNDGGNIGPNLTGMAVHPKEELLVHILDPNQSVEGNFRTFTVLTIDGQIITGMLAGESKTSIEIIDVQGKRQTILREDIEDLNASGRSLMPEGFENQINQNAMADLLEFLTNRGKYTPLSLSGVATAISTRGMFGNADNGPDRIVFPNWETQTFNSVPFSLIDPQDGSVPNVVLLNGPLGRLPPTMPNSVVLPCNAQVAVIHVLGGISGWGYPSFKERSVTATVRLNYADGEREDHPLFNGVHFADYIRRVDVPESEFAFEVDGRQVRYLQVAPKRQQPLRSIELVKGDDKTSPIFVAITIESP